MQYVWGLPLTMAYIALFAWFITRWNHFKDDSIHSKWLLSFFIFKLLMGSLLTLIYSSYYQIRNEADIFKYFDDSAYMTEALYQKPIDFFKMLFGIGNDTDYFTGEYYSKMSNWFRKYETQVYNDNHTVIRLNAVIRIFSFGYFHVHTVFFSFLSFFGIMSFYNAFKLFIAKEKHIYLGFALFLFPSLSFWSAGALKEGIMIFTAGNIFYLFTLLVNKTKSYKYMILGAISFFVMLYLKTYALYAMSVGLTMLIAGFIFKNKNLGWVYLASGLFGGILLILFFEVNNHYNIPSLIHQKHIDFLKHSLSMKAGSTFNLGDFEPNWIGIFKLAPQAALTTLFRPFIWESSGLLILLSSLESLAISLAVICSIFYFQKPKGKELNLVLCCIVIILILSVLIGISTTNFGSLVRYKIIILPFLIFTLISITDIQRIRIFKKART